MATNETVSNYQGIENAKVNAGLTKLPIPFLTGMKLQADIRINGLTLNTIDANNCVWVCTDINGWWDMPDVETPDIPRGLDDGSYDVRGRRKARSMTLNGSVLVPDPKWTPIVLQQLYTAFDLVYTGAWLFVDESPKKSSFVRLVGKPTIDNVNPRGRVNFSIPLRSGDPIKYSWDGVEVSGDGYKSVTVTSNNNLINLGNANVAALYTVTGPLTAPAYIKSTDASSNTQTLTITTDLRDTTYTKPIIARRFIGGYAQVTITDHGYLAGDKVNITGVLLGGSADTRFNATNVTVEAVTPTTVSYKKPIANIVSIAHSSNQATVITETNHGFTGGELIYINGSSNAVLDGAYTVLVSPSPTTDPKKFYYTKNAGNQNTGYGGYVSPQIETQIVATSGDMVLALTDVIQIDTYNNTVLYRGLPDLSRSTLAINVDWIKLRPGNNIHRFDKTGGTGNCVAKYRSGWIG